MKGFAMNQRMHGDTAGRPWRAAAGIGVSLLSAFTLSACIVAPPPPPRHVVYAEPAYGPPIAVVNVAPPSPYVEVVPVAPYAGAVWIGGYWGWANGRHQWVGGHYEAGRPGYGWRPHSWVQINGSWHLRSGGWERR